MTVFLETATTREPDGVDGHRAKQNEVVDFATNTHSLVAKWITFVIINTFFNAGILKILFTFKHALKIKTDILKLFNMNFNIAGVSIGQFDGGD